MHRRFESSCGHQTFKRMQPAFNGCPERPTGRHGYTTCSPIPQQVRPVFNPFGRAVVKRKRVRGNAWRSRLMAAGVTPT